MLATTHAYQGSHWGSEPSFSNTYFFFLQNPVSFPKHRSLSFQSLKKLKSCFPFLTWWEESQLYFGHSNEAAGGSRNVPLSLSWLPLGGTVTLLLHLGGGSSFLQWQVNPVFNICQKWLICSRHPIDPRWSGNFPSKRSEFQFHRNPPLSFQVLKKIPISLLSSSNPRGGCYFCSCNTLKPYNCLFFLFHLTR